MTARYRSSISGSRRCSTRRPRWFRSRRWRRPWPNPSPSRRPRRPPAGGPRSAPPSEQYHSETPPNVSVTQQQPSNVNVSIRINSPGDDGPVVQINNAGGTAVVEQIVERAAAASRSRPRRAGGELPDTWEWVWTSACFGGASERGRRDGGDARLELALVVRRGRRRRPTTTSLAGLPRAARRRRAGRRRADRSRRAVVRRRLARRGRLARAATCAPPTAAPGPGLPAASAAAPARHPPAARPPRGRSSPAPRPMRRPPPRRPSAGTPCAPPRRGRGPGDDGSSSNVPPGGGPGLGAATALGSVASLLLGIWTAVLVTACVLVLPRLRHRRWSGLTGRLTRLPSSAWSALGNPGRRPRNPRHRAEVSPGGIARYQRRKQS